MGPAIRQFDAMRRIARRRLPYLHPTPWLQHVVASVVSNRRRTSTPLPQSSRCASQLRSAPRRQEAVLSGDEIFFRSRWTAMIGTGCTWSRRRPGTPRTSHRPLWVRPMRCPQRRGSRPKDRQEDLLAAHCADDASVGALTRLPEDLTAGVAPGTCGMHGVRHDDKSSEAGRTVEVNLTVVAHAKARA